MINSKFIRKVIDDEQTHEAWFYYVSGDSEHEHMTFSNADVDYCENDCMVVRTTTGLEIINFDNVKKVIIK